VGGEALLKTKRSTKPLVTGGKYCKLVPVRDIFRFLRWRLLGKDRYNRFKSGKCSVNTRALCARSGGRPKPMHLRLVQ
jgi:hypothetical protein